MKLTELEPRFLKIESASSYRDVESISEADGIMFRCPKCYQANGGCVGTHAILCWRPRVPADFKPGPGRWEFAGTGYGDLTLFAASSSVSLTGAGCKAHFHITNGGVTPC